MSFSTNAADALSPTPGGARGHRASDPIREDSMNGAGGETRNRRLAGRRSPPSSSRRGGFAPE